MKTHFSCNFHFSFRTIRSILQTLFCFSYRCGNRPACFYPVAGTIGLRKTAARGLCGPRFRRFSDRSASVRVRQPAFCRFLKKRLEAGGRARRFAGSRSSRLALCERRSEAEDELARQLPDGGSPQPSIPEVRYLPRRKRRAFLHFRRNHLSITHPGGIHIETFAG